jgi:serine/threonine protein kinase
MSSNIKVDEYTLSKLLGKGSYGEVYYTTKEGSNMPYATKRMKREEVENPNYIKYFVNEISILKGLFHKNIVRIETLKKTWKHYYIIMEYYDGGTLKENLIKYKNKYKTPFPERIVQHLMRQLVEAVNFLHERQIVHRDLKLENVLLKYDTREAKDSLDILHSELKLIDFGTATHKSNESLITTVIGSPLTMDPIILKKYIHTLDSNVPYDEKIDIWSLGIMCYYLFTGEVPFKATDIGELVNEIEKGYIKIPINISAEAISFLLNMLQYSTVKRFTSENLLNHPFLQKYIGDFTYLDDKSFPNYTKNGYLYVNIKNNDEINSIINQTINQRQNNSQLSSISFNTNSTKFSKNFGFSTFGGSAPIFKGNMNNFSIQGKSNLYSSASQNPQISKLMIELMNDSKIKEQKELHNSLAFIYGVNDKIQNQTVPNMLIKTNNNQNNIISNNQHMSAVFRSNNNYKNQQEFGYINSKNAQKQNIIINENSKYINNNYQNQTKNKNVQNNLEKESIQNQTKPISKVHNSFSNNGFFSGKYNTVQPQSFYNITGQSIYNNNSSSENIFNNNNGNYQYNDTNSINNSLPIKTTKNNNFQ